ncbi:MAG: hypothetical protein Q4D92_07410 [Slackia sp.]|nr:hypothetical protein [Slackia sp.]
MSDTSKRSYARVAGAVVGTIALVGSASTVPVLALASQGQSDVQAGVVQQSTLAADDQSRPQKVEGVFGYSQDVVTPTDRIASVFRVAATSFCASMPEYLVSEMSKAVTVGGSAASSEYVGTVADMAAEDESTSYLMACSCASNIAGGGAIANAEVSGVSVESLARLVGAM